MAQDRSDQDMMGYEALSQEALRGVIKSALRRAAQPDGLPGAHHLYITFKTRAAGVSAPIELTERYPDEMTIVLQHQFWDLAPGETFFSVTLKFGGQPKRLSIPYVAVTRFFDPSVQFMLQWPAPEVAPAEIIQAPIVPAAAARAPKKAEPKPVSALSELAESEAADAPEPPKDDPDGDGGPKVVSLDQFRKK
jgi:uncharacterized protein